MTPVTKPLQGLRVGTTDPNIGSPSVLGVLRALRYGARGTVRMAVELLVEYARRRPSDLPKVAHVLGEDFGFSHTSFAPGYWVERVVIDAIWDHCQPSEDEAFHRSPPSRRYAVPPNAFSDGTIEGRPIDRDHALRNLCRRRSCSSSHCNLGAALHSLQIGHEPAWCYRRSAEVRAIRLRGRTARDIGRGCARSLHLSPTSIHVELYAHAAVALEALDHLQRHDVAIDDSLRKHLQGPAHDLAEALFNDFEQQREIGAESYAGARLLIPPPHVRLARQRVMPFSTGSPRSAPT